MSKGLFFRAMRALLPTGRAWDITQPTGLRKIFEAIAPLPEDIRQEFERVYFDYFPDTTRALEKWEEVFHVVFADSLFSDDERRMVLRILWQLRYGDTTGEFMKSVLRLIIPNVNVTDNVPVGNVQGLGFAYRSVNGNKYMCCGNKNAFCNFHVGDQTWLPDLLRNNTAEIYDLPRDARYWSMCFFISGEVFRDENKRFIAFQRLKVAPKWKQFIEFVVLALKPVQSTAVLFLMYTDESAPEFEVIGKKMVETGGKK